MRKNPGRKERRRLSRTANSRRGEVKAIDRKNAYRKAWKKLKAKRKMARKQRKVA